MYFDFLYKFIWSIYHSKKNLERYCRQCENVFMYSTRNACQILTKLKFSRQIFEIISSTKFHQNPSSGSKLFHTDGQTYKRTGQTDMTKPTVAFSNIANAPKKKQVISSFCTYFKHAGNIVLPVHSHSSANRHIYMCNSHASHSFISYKVQ